MRISCLQSPFRTLVFTALLFLIAPQAAHAQSPYLYASIPGGTTSQILGFSVAPDGSLKQVPGTFNVSGEGGLLTTDPADQYLFVLNATSNTISVLSIDQTTGALTELTSAGSPFGAPISPTGGAPLSGPICVTTFKNAGGSYLYIAYRNGPSAFTSAIVTFQIGTPAQPQPLFAPSIMSLDATPVDMTVSPQGFLYAALQLVPGSTLGSQTPGVGVFFIDPNSGQLGQPDFANSNVHEQSLALSPGARFLFDGWGTASGGIESALILPSGLTAAPNTIALTDSNSPPSAMFVDGSGHLLYVEENGQLVAYIIDPASGALTASPVPPTEAPLTLTPGNTVADLIEPFLYTLQSGLLQVFAITDITTGALIENGSPYPVGGADHLTLTHNAAARTSIALAAQLNPPAINFVDTNVGESSPGTPAQLTNTGTQPLGITSILITGDPVDFTSTTNCPSQLTPGSSCVIIPTFEPIQTGALSATITVTDAAGTQTIPLTGTGQDATSGGSGGSGGSGSGGSSGSGSGGSSGSGSGSGSGGSSGSGSGSGSGGSGGSGSGGSGGNPPPTPQPAITLSATSLSFTSTAINATTAAQDLTITNSGTAALNITSIQLKGPNASDFKLTNGCSISTGYLQNQGCTLNVSFTPSGSGSRFAQIAITDNAANSTPLIQLSGVTQSEAVTISPNSPDGMSETVSAGQTATYKLNLVSTFNGSVSFSPCVGAPANATCTVPTPISLEANQTASFSITVATVAASSISRSRLERPSMSRRTRETVAARWHQAPALLPIAFMLFFLSALSLRRASYLHTIIENSHTFPLPASAFIVTLLLLLPLAIAGCGGASTIATAPTTITPASASQTYTITVTPTATTADNLPVPIAQPITLTLVVD
jgi:centrosomal CEP192-like protein/lactonase family protein with 7-bladed beta-propeller